MHPGEQGRLWHQTRPRSGNAQIRKSRSVALLGVEILEVGSQSSIKKVKVKARVAIVAAASLLAVEAFANSRAAKRPVESHRPDAGMLQRRFQAEIARLKDVLDAGRRCVPTPHHKRANTQRALGIFRSGLNNGSSAAATRVTGTDLG